MNKKATIIFLFLSGLVCLVLFSAQKKNEVVSESRLMMNTVITINVYNPNDKVFAERGFEVFKKIEDTSSFHLPTSELSRLNKAKKLKSNAFIADLLRLAGHFYGETNGYFDPSFAVIQGAYGFYSGKPRLPTPCELKELLKSCGFSQVLNMPLSSASDGFFALASGSIIDLGGIAGGYAVKKAADEMKKAGCKCFLIDDAGDIWFEGQKPRGDCWRIAVRDPNTSKPLAVIESYTPLAISTSGDYERFIEVDGKKYGHIMNPFTGCPVNYYSSVTIIASSPIAADALSTAVFAMPFEQAKAYVEEKNIAALMLSKDKSIYVSPAGNAYFKCGHKT